MNLILQTPSGSGKVSLTSRVVNQRYQNSAIKDGYTTNIPDQGIFIDASGRPYDRQPDCSERRSPPPHQSGGATEDGHGPPQGPPGNPPGGPLGGSDSDPSYQDTGSGEEDEEKTSSSDEEEDVEELFTALVTPESRGTAMLSAQPTPPVTAPITGAKQTGFHHECGDRSPMSISNAHRTAREMWFVPETRLGNGDQLFLDPYQQAHTIELDSYRDKN
jgi:hypothetical protein